MYRKFILAVLLINSFTLPFGADDAQADSTTSSVSTSQSGSKGGTGMDTSTATAGANGGLSGNDTPARGSSLQKPINGRNGTGIANTKGNSNVNSGIKTGSELDSQHGTVNRGDMIGEGAAGNTGNGSMGLGSNAGH